MPFFPCAHAGHPVWSHAVKQVIVQLRAQVSMQHLDGQSCLGVVYVSAAYAEHATHIMAMLSGAFPEVQHWVGCAGHAVLAGDMDYGHTGAVAAMLPYIDRANYEVFCGAGPWRGTVAPYTVLLHGDAASQQLAQQLQDCFTHLPGAMAIGGLCDLQPHAQWSWGPKEPGSMPASIGGGGVQVGGLSGVVFTDQVGSMVVGMQGCKPIGDSHTVTEVEGDVLLTLDGQPALPLLFPQENWAQPMQAHHGQPDAGGQPPPHTYLAVMPSDAYLHSDCLPTQARVLRVIGVDPLRQGVVVDGRPPAASVVVRCQSDSQAARADMRRACAQLWEALTATQVSPDGTVVAAPGTGRSICGAVYIRNRQRHAMARSMQVDSELQLIRHALGPVPLLGFTTSVEVDGGQLHHMSAQLLVFTQPLAPLS